jgi:hypothetical protein
MDVQMVRVKLRNHRARHSYPFAGIQYGMIAQILITPRRVRKKQDFPPDLTAVARLLMIALLLGNQLAGSYGQ